MDAISNYVILLLLGILLGVILGGRLMSGLIHFGFRGGWRGYPPYDTDRRGYSVIDGILLLIFLGVLFALLLNNEKWPFQPTESTAPAGAVHGLSGFTFNESVSSEDTFKQITHSPPVMPESPRTERPKPDTFYVQAGAFTTHQSAQRAIQEFHVTSEKTTWWIVEEDQLHKLWAGPFAGKERAIVFRDQYLPEGFIITW